MFFNRGFNCDQPGAVNVGSTIALIKLAVPVPGLPVWWILNGR